MRLNNEIKIAIKNTFLYFQQHNLDFNPQSFSDILYAECRAMGVKFDESEWFSAWSGRFDSATKKELQNSPIKTRDDFIDKIAQIHNHKVKNTTSNDLAKILQKALMLLKLHNIIDFNANLPLNTLDTKLSALLSKSHSLPQMEAKNEVRKISNFFANLNAQNLEIDKNQKILLCKFSEQSFLKKLDAKAYNRLLRSFCALLLDNLDTQNVIGIYKNAVAIFTKYPIDTFKVEIEHILDKHTFMLHNKPLRLKIAFEAVPFGELN